MTIPYYMQQRTLMKHTYRKLPISRLATYIFHKFEEYDTSTLAEKR